MLLGVSDQGLAREKDSRVMSDWDICDFHPLRESKNRKKVWTGRERKACSDLQTLRGPLSEDSPFKTEYA